MAGERVYLDYNATAPVLAVARDAAVRAIDESGNPSSVHREGRTVRALVEEARGHVAALAGVGADRIVFTSGGTEAAVLALQPAMTGPGNLLFVAAGEHPCVLQGHGFAAERVRMIGLDGEGRIDLDQLDKALAAVRRDNPQQAVTLALQGANNETGVIQPIAAAAELVHAHGGALVCDAVQLAGRADCAAVTQGADFLVLTGHKIGGLKGCGALVGVSGLPEAAAAILRGGGQERGLRCGTENTSGIAAFGAAARWALENATSEAGRLGAMRDRFEAALLGRHGDAVIFGRGALRLPNTCSFSIPGMSAETLLIAFDLAGLAVSSGSACSSGKVKSSHVLEAMGVEPQIARGAIRVSLGHASKQGDLDALLAGLDTARARMKARAQPPKVQTAA